MDNAAVGFAGEGFGLRSAALDVINSDHWDGFGQRTEHLDDPAWCAAFLARWGWADMAAAEPLPRADVTRLRARLRRIVDAVAAGQGVGADDAVALDGWLASPARRHLARDTQGYTLEWAPLEAGWSWIMAEIAASMVDMLVPHQSRRLKVCPNPGCRWAFYDETNGNTRRWCNDRACGNRDKVRRFRARRTGVPAAADADAADDMTER